MMRFSKLSALIAISAAAAAVQSCTDGAADVLDAASQPLEADAIAAAAAPCPAGAAPVAVGEAIHCRLAGVIGADLHLVAGHTYQLDGRVVFGVPVEGASRAVGPTLRIDPGVTVYALDRGSSLEISRGAQIMALGAADAPVVFTSAYDLGLEGALGLPPRVNVVAPRGEWAGLIVSGRSDVSGVHGVMGAACASDASDAVWCERPGEAGSGPYGGALGREDSSGALRHVEIRYAGAFARTADGALRRAPALALQGVGARTVVEAVAIVNAFGDGLRLLGGHVEANAVSILGAGDDGIDWSLGYRGVLRNVVVTHDARLGDADNGLEGSTFAPGEMAAFADADADANLINAIVSRPTLIDVVVIGEAGISDGGIVLARGADIVVDGAVLSGDFAQAAFDIDGAEAYRLIAPQDLSGVELAADGLSRDFDDARLRSVFAAGDRGNALAAPAITVAEAVNAVALRLEEEPPTAFAALTAPAPPAEPKAENAEAAAPPPEAPPLPVPTAALEAEAGAWLRVVELGARGPDL